MKVPGASVVATLALCFCADAEPISLAFPVECTLGQDCFIQNYVDRDPSDGYQDVACGHLSYDGHTGTDIALFTERDLARDVRITPVAPGTVRAMRDGMPDINAFDPAAPDLTGRSCGNAVVIEHADGWESTYCHLKRGSVRVRSGDLVDLSTELGIIGLSGLTEFPHLHLTLRRDGAPVDPFNPTGAPACGPFETTLWKDPIPYRAAGLLTAGAAPALPEFDAVKAGTAHHSEVSRTADVLVFYAHFFGPAAGDHIVFEIDGPGGPFLTQQVDLDRDQARAFRAVGRRLRNDAWPTGVYQARIQMIRDGREIDRITTQVEIK